MDLDECTQLINHVINHDEQQENGLPPSPTPSSLLWLPDVDPARPQPNHVSTAGLISHLSSSGRTGGVSGFTDVTDSNVTFGANFDWGELTYQTIVH